MATTKNITLLILDYLQQQVVVVVGWVGGCCALTPARLFFPPIRSARGCRPHWRHALRSPVVWRAWKPYKNGDLKLGKTVVKNTTKFIVPVPVVTRARFLADLDPAVFLNADLDTAAFLMQIRIQLLKIWKNYRYLMKSFL